MFLCTVTAKNLNKIFNISDNEPTEIIRRPSEDYGLVMIGQAPDCSSYLALATKSNEFLIKQSSIPEGYIFIFRQEWGFVLNEATLHRIVATLRAEAYPPMADYLDAKVKGDTAQEKAYLDACAAVKLKYPKFSF
jgi:hypothetical protein